MKDLLFEALRNIIHDSIEEEFISEDSELNDACNCESLTVSFTDNGLAVQLDDTLYGITIERV